VSSGWWVTGRNRTEHLPVYQTGALPLSYGHHESAIRPALHGPAVSLREQREPGFTPRHSRANPVP
jgi:hypothetical protein